MPDSETDALHYGRAVSAILIAEPGSGARAARDAIDAAGVRVAAQLGFEPALARFDIQAHVDLVVVEAIGVDTARLEPVLARCVALGADHGVAIVVALDEGQLDLVGSQLLGACAHLLCRPSAAERLAAAVLAKVRPGGRLHDSSGDDGRARLHRLQEEVARIAEVLARLTQEEDTATPSAVREPVSGYRGPDEGGPDDIAAAEVRATIRARRMRSQFFASELFADPAWDMLLDLFAAELEQQRVSVSSLCIAAAVPPTTALRWITALHDAGLFERQADPSDRRRAYIALSAKGIEGMKAYAAAAKRAGLPLV